MQRDRKTVKENKHTELNKKINKLHKRTIRTDRRAEIKRKMSF